MKTHSLRRVSKESGFTLLELLIVLAILIVILGLSTAGIMTAQKNAYIRSAEVEMKHTFGNALEQFHLDNHRYPTTAEGLEILVGKVNPNATATAGQTGLANPMGVGTGTDLLGGVPAAGMTDPMMGGAGMTDPMMGGAGMTDPMMGGAAMGTGMTDPMMGGAAMGTGMTDPMMGGTGAVLNPNTGAVVQTQTTVPPRQANKSYMDSKEIPKDPWGNPYQYEYPTTRGGGEKPAIWSFGPDKKNDQGGNDDVISWDPSITAPEGTTTGTAAIDPLTGQPINTGMGTGAVDPMTGMPINTGMGAGGVDPLTGQPINTGMGTGAVDPMTGMPVNTGTGF